MRRILFVAIVTTVAMALAAGDAFGRPGRGGGPGGGAPGGAGPRAGGAASGNRPGPTSGGAKINSPGKQNARPGNISPGNISPGSIGKNPAGNAANKFNGQRSGQFDKGAFDKGAFEKGNLNGRNLNERPGNEQLQEFLGDKGEAVKSGEFTRGEKATQSKEQFQAQASQIQSNVQGRADDLFTPQWYAQHPNAWQATHPHADAWAVATAASVAAWVGSAAYAGTDTVVVESGTTEEGTTTDESTTDETTTTGTTTTAAAADPTEWLTIGVFALAQTGQTEPTTLIQLSVNKQGLLNGTYYDLVSDNGTPIAGQIDTTTERAAWTVGPNSKNVFTTTIETLTSETGPAKLNLPGGKTQDWNLIRVNKPAE
jgi:hypothetical protein